MTGKSDWILIPDEQGGGHIAIAREHVLRVELSPIANAIGSRTGELRLRLCTVDGGVQSVRGIQNIKQVLADLAISGLTPKSKENEEAA
jgi:hypothetical protein